MQSALSLPALLSFPSGYAPALGIGVRFFGGSVAPPTVVEAIPARVDGKPHGKIEMVAVPGFSESSLPPPEVKTVDSWVTTTSFAAEQSAGALSLPRALGGVLAMVVAWGALLFVRRKRATVSDSDVPSGDYAANFKSATSDMAAALSSVDNAAICSELIARAVNLHRAARDAVVALTNDNLRTLMSDDLARVQRILLAPELTNDVAECRWEPVKVKVTAALTDLERIARIIAGVLSSACVAPMKTELSLVPETSSEAFEILGVNPDASRTVVKKVVDGLRQSWHPDHARDVADRHRREDRMKQINIAWDLIRDQYPATEKTAA